MTATGSTAPRPGRLPDWLSRRGLFYGALALLILVPLAVFGIAGTNATGFNLEGGAGPVIAFSAGVLSFVSPCVLSIVPIFVTNMAGATIDAEGKVSASRGTMFGHGVAFMGGHAATFIVLGASVGLIGYTLLDHQRDLEQGAGLLMLVLGVLIVPEFGRRSMERSIILLVAIALVSWLLIDLAQIRGDMTRTLLLLVAMTAVWARFAGFLPGTSVLMRTYQLNPAAEKSASLGRSVLIGGAFGVGWIPCTGPILGGILNLAAASASAWTGAYLLLAYSLGLSIPFLITALAINDVSRGIRKLRPIMPAFEVAAAVMIVGLGILLVSGRLTEINSFFGFAEFNQGL
jgi:cytochrome c-type biogenesis protein